MWVPLVREARSWWAIAKAKATDGAKAKRKPRTKGSSTQAGVGAS